MNDDLICSGCGEYAGSPIADRIESLTAQLAQRDAALKAADDLADAWRKYQGLFCEGDEDLVESALAAYRKARGQDA